MAETLKALFICKVVRGAAVVPPQDGEGLHLVYTDPETGIRRDGDGVSYVCEMPDATALVQVTSTPETIREMEQIGLDLGENADWQHIEDLIEEVTNA